MLWCDLVQVFAGEGFGEAPEDGVAPSQPRLCGLVLAPEQAPALGKVAEFHVFDLAAGLELYQALGQVGGAALVLCVGLKFVKPVLGLLP